MKYISAQIFLPALLSLSFLAHLNPVAAESKRAIVFTPPSDSPRPQSSKGGASRSPCLREIADESSSYPQALVPQINGESVGGVTYQSHPQLWVYLPANSATKAVVSLREQETQAFHSRFEQPITGKSEAIGIQLPESKQPLSPGKTYEWSVILVCGQQVQPGDPGAYSVIRRESLSAPSQAQLQTEADAITKAQWYAQQGIWYDLIATLSNPGIAVEERQAFWESVGFEELFEFF